MIQIDQELYAKILNPLPDNDGVGVWLKYDPVYDQIRKNRIEEDDGTLRQAWEADLKHANWQEVERTCITALCEKSKDLQIVSWLIEARQKLYGLKGLQISTKLFVDFITVFWDKLYPQINEDADQSFRTHIIEAMIRSVQVITLTEPIEELKILFSPPPSLSKCYEADSFEKLSKRGGEAAEVFQKEIEKGLITMDRVRKAFHEVNKNLGVEKIDLIDKCITNLQNIEKTIRDSIGDDAPRFSELISHLNELKGLYKLCSREVAPVKSEDAENVDPGLAGVDISEEPIIEGTDNKVTDRSGVYQAIRDIGDFLFSLDPHSPSPLILKIIGSWENKNIAEILADLQNASPEVKSLFALLYNASQKPSGKDNSS